MEAGYATVIRRPNIIDTKDRCSHMNDFFEQRKREINRRMVEFLKENNGVIDRWPSPESNCGAIFDDGMKFGFNYEGQPYQLCEGGVKRVGEEPVMLAKCEFPNEYAEAMKELEQKKKSWAVKVYGMEKTMEEEELNWKGLRIAIALIPVFIGLLFAAVCLVGFFLDINPTAMSQMLVDAAGNAESWQKAADVLRMLMVFPGLIWEFSGFGTWAFVIALLVVEGLFALATRILWKMFLPKPTVNKAEYAEAGRAYAAAKAELSRLEEQRATVRNNNVELSRAWNAEYHRVLKAKDVRVTS